MPACATRLMICLPDGEVMHLATVAASFLRAPSSPELQTLADVPLKQLPRRTPVAA